MLINAGIYSQKLNLYYNSQSKEYIDLENDISVIKISGDNLVSIHKRYLKSYLAVKNMALIMHIDSRCVDITGEKFPTDGIAYRNEDNTIFYIFFFLSLWISEE